MKYCISRRMGQAGFFFFFSKTKKGPCPRIAWILHPFETETKKVKKRKEVKILTVIIELLDVLRWWCSDLLIRKFFESRMKVFIFIKIFTSSNQSLWGESLVCGYCCSRWRLQSDDVHTHTLTARERDWVGLWPDWLDCQDIIGWSPGLHQPWNGTKKRGWHVGNWDESVDQSFWVDIDHVLGYRPT